MSDIIKQDIFLVDDKTSAISVKNNTIVDSVEVFLLRYNSEQTKRAYYLDIIGFFSFAEIFYLRDLNLYTSVEITKKINDYLASKAKKERYRPDHILNPKTINRLLYSLSAFFSFLVLKHNYPFNPITNFKRLEESKKSTTDSLNKSEIKMLLEYAELNKTKSQIDYRDYVLLLMLASMALRRAEIVNLRWIDINKHKAILTVFDKGRKYKYLPIPDKIITELNNLKKMYREPSQYIFKPIVNNKSGILDKPLSTDSVFKIVKEMTLKFFPKRNITPHSFRKSFIEISLSAGIDPSSIKNATGHKSLDALRYYDGRDEIANNAVNSILDHIQ